MGFTSEEDKRLVGRVVPVNQLDDGIRDSMFALMQQFYFVERPAFFSDLANKSSVVLLADCNGVLQGFTSVALFDLNIDDEPVKILFSGDTIVHPDFWGSLELPRVWGKFMFETLQACGETPLYWFLISSGYKTYRFLPTYFNEFFPRHDCETPAQLQKILDIAATELFNSAYDADRGIIRLENPTPLRSGVSDPSKERQANRHIAFFLLKNPGHNSGDELACIARLHLDNFKSYVRRLLKI
ncbi:MAG: hypothetical protein CVV42_03615 [Candidatus Riflebacteria bacterium HGW-Riflebacteria-2]|jgi:hypothetical protein|nr:MAG: hypothetical protein CVV42_03615 [Candidatus Riflebacteria bacterium HGW-Riflebacteria-2]